MIDDLAEFFKILWVPGSATFFLFCLIAAAILLSVGKRASAWGKRFLIAIAIFGYLISTPLIASSLLRGIGAGYQGLVKVSPSDEIDAVVILGGGGATYQVDGAQLDMLSASTSLRVLEGFRLYDAHAPDWIIVSGGTNDRAGVSTPESETMAVHLVELGIPSEQILIERLSANTREQALNIPPLLEKHEIDQFILVTSPTHMRRADLSFQAEGMHALTSTAPSWSETRPDLGWSPLPSAEALEVSRDVFRELVGLVYYALRGWI